MTTDREVVVIGGGTAGLAAAVALRDRGVDVEVLEASEAAGGFAAAVTEGGFVLALGPQSFRARSPNVWWLARRLGLVDRATPARGATRRYVWHGGRLVELPRGPASFLGSPLLSWRGKLRLLAEPFRRRGGTDGESVLEFATRRVGPEAARVLLGTFVSGVYAGDPSQLEARAAFPLMASWEREAGSLVRGALGAALSRADGNAGVPRRGVFSFPGGVAELPRTACAELRDRVTSGVRVDRILREGGGWRVIGRGAERRARRLVLAVPPPAASALLLPLHEDASRAAGAVPMAPVAVIHLGGPLGPGERRPEGFGALVPRDAGLDVLGVVFTSSLFPAQAPPGAWLQATFLGGVTNPRVVDLPDDRLREMAAEQTHRVLGFHPDRGLCRIFRHREAIPQLVTGHRDRVALVRRAAAAAGGIAVAGNWLDGTGLDHAVASGRAAAERVAA